MSRLALAAAVFTLAAAARSLAADATALGNAKALYAQASYEEALAQLSGAPEADVADEVDQYRALCLLALGRDGEARESIERLVARTPLYVVKEDEASPKLVTMFHDVRRQTLPATAKNLYTSGRTHYDAKQFAEAGEDFKQLLAILGAGADLGSSVADLKELGEGFLKLTDAELARAAAPAPPPSPAPAAAPASLPTQEAQRQIPKIYGPEDAGVVAPVDIDRRLPAWQPPQPFEHSTFHGILEVLIDEQGLVESASMAQPITPMYDSKLIDASKHWRFHPATVNGVPVKYREAIGIELRPPVR